MNHSFIKVDRKSKNFLCALCSKPRSMKHKKNLSSVNHMQILLLGASLSYFTWSFVGVNSLLILPILWCVIEFTNKLFYRKELPCPHCGFDATWYKRDVKVAKAKVQEFWEAKRLESTPTIDETTDLEASLH